MKLKRILAMLGAAAMMVPSVLTFPASAEDLQGADDILSDGAFEYVNVDGGYKITKCTATIITEIPAIRNGVAIVAIGENAFAGFTGITDLIIPDSVKSIETNAFYGCTSSTIKLPKNLKYLGEGAFSGCYNVTELKIPDTLTEIPESAFRRCDSLKKLELNSTLTAVGDYAFYGCMNLESLELPPTLTTIGDEAFGELYSLKEIKADGSSTFTVNDGILTDKDKKEIYCAVSTIGGELRIPDGTEVIRAGAFSAAAGIEYLYLPSSVTEIGDGAFSGIVIGEAGGFSKLKSIDFSNGLVTIGANAFSYNCIESLSLPTTLKTIGDSAFNGSYSLEKVIIPDGVKSIGSRAFFYCDNLKKIAVPKSVTDIGDYAFGYTWEYNGNTTSDGQKLLEETKLSGFKMSVPSGSEAKKYAKSNGISYTVTDFNLLKWAFIVLCFALLAAAVVFGVVLMSRSRKSAPRRVRNAQKREKAKAFENSYKKIIDDEEPENKQAPLKKTSGNKKTSDNEKPSGSNKASGSSKSSGGKKSAGNKSKK